MKYQQILDAQQRLAGKARKTPLLRSPFLDEIAGRPLWVKAECLQHTGSFKFRGGWSAISALSAEQKANGILAYSSGNHAQGVAAAAKAHGVRAVIVMPKDAPKIKIANTKALGAQVVFYDRAAGERREDIGVAIIQEQNLTLIPPYDLDTVIAGQGSVGLEIGEQAKAEGIENAEVLVCCGGGGLTSSIALALEQVQPDFKVRPVEPENFDDTARSLKLGKHVANNGLTTGLCDAIITPTPGDLTFPIMKRLCEAGLVVTDDEVKRAMALAFSRLKLVVEPGGAVALAAALFHADKLSGDHIIAVATGGNVDSTLFADVLRAYG